MRCFSRLVDGADIEVAIGRQNHAVDAAVRPLLAGQVVGQLNAGAPIGRATGRECVERRRDSGLLIARRRFEHGARSAGVHGDGDAIDGTELVDQQLERSLQEVDLVGALHRARHVHEKHQVRGRQVGRRALEPLQADVEQLSTGVPWARRELGVDRERAVLILRCGIGVVEVVDELLGANRVRIRQHTLIEQAADVGVGGRIDVDRKGRHGVLECGVHGIVVEVRVPLPVDGAGRRIEAGRGTRFKASRRAQFRDRRYGVVAQGSPFDRGGVDFAGCTGARSAGAAASWTCLGRSGTCAADQQHCDEVAAQGPDAHGRSPRLMAPQS
jgi:hypothetical protein